MEQCFYGLAATLGKFAKERKIAVQKKIEALGDEMHCCPDLASNIGRLNLRLMKGYLRGKIWPS